MVHVNVSVCSSIVILKPIRSAMPVESALSITCTNFGSIMVQFIVS